MADAISKHLRGPGKIDNSPVYGGAMARLAGTWNVTIQYVRGVGRQTFVLRQEGSTLTGDQKGEIFQAAFKGKVEADHVTLSSVMAANGYQVPFNFNGIVTGNTMSGDVKMGEYGPATFTAVRA